MHKNETLMSYSDAVAVALCKKLNTGGGEGGVFDFLRSAMAAATPADFCKSLMAHFCAFHYRIKFFYFSTGDLF